jgi:hypothetical protein
MAFQTYSKRASTEEATEKATNQHRLQILPRSNRKVENTKPKRRNHQRESPSF